MKLTGGVNVTVDRLNQVGDSIRELASNRVMAGVPAEKAGRKSEDQPINNAELMYIHENGSPEAHIPARPVVHPAIKSIRAQVISHLRGAGVAAMSGKRGDIQKHFHALGLIAQNAMRNRINAGVPPPLAESTLKKRAALAGQGKGVAISKGAEAELARRAAGGAPGTDLAKPLILTGQLMRSLTYVVRKVNWRTGR